MLPFLHCAERNELSWEKNRSQREKFPEIPNPEPLAAVADQLIERHARVSQAQARFRNSKAVGAAFGLTPSKHQSGESNRTGGISRCGDEMMRMMLYEAAHIMLVRSAKWSWLKAWAMKIARHRGLKKAIVALARRLAVIMHRIWVDGTEFRWTREAATA